MSSIDRTCNLQIIAWRCCLELTLMIPLSGMVNWLMGTVRLFQWLVSSIFKLNQILTMSLWNCFRKNICL